MRATRLIEYLARVVFFAGVLIGLRNLVLSASADRMEYGGRLSHVTFFVALTIVILALAEACCQYVGYVSGEPFGSAWRAALTITRDLAEHFFYAGVVFGLWFISAVRGRASPALDEALSGGGHDTATGLSVAYPCPKCFKRVQKKWIACPYCSEGLYRVEGYHCPQCGGFVADDWTQCPHCWTELGLNDQRDQGT
jgi:hypothetical protein